MLIRRALASDLRQVLGVERAAFGSDEEARLVEDLMDDESATPTLSLVAFLDGQAVGHILFTKARLEPTAGVSIVLLAPLAVVPQYQRQGIGGRLIEQGLQILSAREVDLVFVLGHPEYYPRHGFRPAAPSGFDPTYAIPAENTDAWMFLELHPGAADQVHGRVICADKLNRPKYWRE